MSYQHLAHLFTELRQHLHRRYHADFDQAMRTLDELELTVGEAISHTACDCECHRRHHNHRPAHITVTDSAAPPQRRGAT